MTLPRAIGLGGATVALLDGLDALVFFGLRGVAPDRVLQAIAAGLLGPDAFAGGAATVVVGAVLHVVIAMVVVAVACLAAHHLPARVGRAVRDHSLLCGAVYGVTVYLVMAFVVIPLSAATSGGSSAAVVLNGAGIHIFGVGIPAALFARASLPGSPDG